MKPLTKKQIEYRKFLKGDLWKALTAQKRLEQPICEQCGHDKKLHSHHISYPKRWEDTTMDHLKTLCNVCHRIEHGLAVWFPFDFLYKETMSKIMMTRTSPLWCPPKKTLRLLAHESLDEDHDHELEGLVRLVARIRLRREPPVSRLWPWSKAFVAKLKQEPLF